MLVYGQIPSFALPSNAWVELSLAGGVATPAPPAPSGGWGVGWNGRSEPPLYLWDTGEKLRNKTDDEMMLLFFLWTEMNNG
jgi:hypothetical protein